MVSRDLQPRLTALAKQFPALILTGPRQSGKSTLCRAAFPRLPYVTLESPDVRQFALDDPRGFLHQFPTGAILDEVQNCPALSSYLQELIDQNPLPGRWVLTGSQNFALLHTTSQSLAGRAAILHLLPLSHNEVIRFRRHPETLDEALVSGGYPRILDQRLKPADWLAAYVSAYLERDVRALSNIGDLVTFQRFLQLCAGRVSQLLNLSSLAADCGISQPTARAWLSVLEASFILFRLPSFHGNVSKRLIKMPKLHFYDSGLVCWLLGIRDTGQLNAHPLRGAIFESWVVAEIIKHRFNAGETNGVYFYRDRNGLESDALVRGRNKSTLVEAKAGQTISSDMAFNVARIAGTFAEAGEDTRSVIIYGGKQTQTRHDVSYLPWNLIQQHPWTN